MSANCLNIFPTALCLNQHTRPDRWKQAKEEFDRVGVQVDQFLALPADEPWKSFCRSQHAMIGEMRNDGGSAIGFEDDCIFRDCGHLQHALDELPWDWDILYLGANILDPAPKKVRKHIFRITGAWTSHAIIYSSRVINFIHTHYNPDTDQMYDDWLNKKVLPIFNCYIIYPMVCWQRPGNSDLWGKQTDYTPCFVDGNAKMSLL